MALVSVKALGTAQLTSCDTSGKPSLPLAPISWAVKLRVETAAGYVTHLGTHLPPVTALSSVTPVPGGFSLLPSS
jgi:hypothetical protein